MQLFLESSSAQSFLCSPLSTLPPLPGAFPRRPLEHCSNLENPARRILDFWTLSVQKAFEVKERPTFTQGPSSDPSNFGKNVEDRRQGEARLSTSARRMHISTCAAATTRVGQGRGEMCVPSQRAIRDLSRGRHQRCKSPTRGEGGVSDPAVWPCPQDALDQLVSAIRRHGASTAGDAWSMLQGSNSGGKASPLTAFELKRKLSDKFGVDLTEYQAQREIALPGRVCPAAGSLFSVLLLLQPTVDKL